MTRYLISYYPLCMNKRGNKAISKYKDSPFLDHSVRREPSFESTYPGITSICRGRNFAPRLKEGDIIVYITIPGIYGELKVEHYRLVAILQVIHKCSDHESAANWYKEKELKIPSNCIVSNNPPLSYERTVHTLEKAMESENEYIRRVLKNPDYLICEALKLELDNPPIILKSELENATGFTPSSLKGTQNPGADNITEKHLEILTKMFDG